MKRIFLHIVILALLPVCASAGERDRTFPRVTFGIEGSAAVTLGMFYHYNYIAEEGYRVNRKGMNRRAALNGQLAASVGCNFSRNINLSLNLGMSGIYRSKVMFPASLRATVLFGDSPLENRWFTFAEGGAGISFEGEDERPSPFGKLGAGYRISLSRSVKLDFLFACQLVYTHPDVSEDGGGVIIPVTGDRLRRNEAFVSALTFGIGLSF